MPTIELLAPARDLACGIAAVDCGADAVYIGTGALVALGALLVALAPSPAGAGEGVPSLEELRAFAQKLIESKEVEVFPFHVSVSEGVVTFDSGDVVACSR